MRGIERHPGLRALAVSLLTAAVLAVGPDSARGDVVAATRRPAAVGVTLIELRGGELIYRSAAGEEVSRSISDIEYLQIVGWPLFNLAEKELRDRHFRPAIAAYERALSELRHAPATTSRLDRELLLRCRLVRAYDANKQFARALDVYLQVLDSESGGAAYLNRLRPTSLPEPVEREAARVRIEAAIELHKDDAIGPSLSAWRDTWTPAPAAAQPVPPASTQDAGTPDKAHITAALSKAQELVERGRGEDALKALADIAADAAGSHRPEWFYWHGRALLVAAENTASENSTLAWQRAGLAFMRVVILYPDHPRAAECLYRAGELCGRTAQPEAAVALWSELLRRYPAAAPWAQQARKELYPQAAAGHSGGRPEQGIKSAGIGQQQEGH